MVVSLLIILIVMMQRPKQEGLGAAFGGGMMNDIAGAHTTDILQKGTVWLSVFFFSISILLGILYTQQIEARSNVKVLDGVKKEQLPQGPPPSISEFPAPIPAEQPITPEDGAPADPTPAPASEGDAPKPAETDGAAAPAPVPVPAPAAETPAPPADAEKPADTKPEPPKTESGGSEEADKPSDGGVPQ
jgi:protein translocase SecG subunit